MTDTQFAIARYVSVPVAVTVLGWWLLLPSQLRLEQASETPAVTTRWTFKGQPVVYLQTPTFGEIRVPCSNAAALCAVPSHSQVRVWLQKPSLVNDYWVVQAESAGHQIVTAEDQVPAYRVAKLMWGFGTAIVVAVAIMLWYFGPFKRTDEHET
jgi:hypothetical protein